MKISPSRRSAANRELFAIWVALTLVACPALAQTYTQRGFIESQAVVYPQEAPNDDARFVGDSLLRYEGFYRPSKLFQVNGTLDVRTDTHHQTERELHLSWWDREQRRPLAEIRRLSGVYHSGGLSFEAGKQFVRWGKADILNPTDRFAPRDYLTVVDNDFLGITAARLLYEKGSETLDVVWSPRLTPSRIPLPNQRWTAVSENVPPSLRIRDGGAQFPGSSQIGVRWNHVGFVELSGAYYEGFNHLPAFEAAVSSDEIGPVVSVRRFYPKLRMVGGDVAIPLHPFELKAEGAYFSSSDRRSDDYAQYVIQLERHSGEWTFVGGYAGEHVFEVGALPGTFAPDRGLTKTFLGSAQYTIDVNRSVSFQTSVRQNLDGVWMRAEFSQAIGQHWRATANINVIRGDPFDFLGQYRHNSHATLILRYSF